MLHIPVVAISANAMPHDIEKGRLVAPFDVRLPEDAGYYFVAPEEKAVAPKITAFREWLLTSVTA